MISKDRDKSSFERGRRAEELASQYLIARGLKPVARNFRFARGEIDLIMRDGDTLVFVEVRSRRSSDFGSAQESVYTVKQRRLIMTAQRFLQCHSQFARSQCRFDVVVLAPGASVDGVEWIQDAFQA